MSRFRNLNLLPFRVCDAQSLAGNYPYTQGRLTHRRLPFLWNLGIQACTTCRDGGLGVRRPGTQASRRHASRGVLCVECPIVSYEALIRVDGCFSAAPPLVHETPPEQRCFAVMASLSPAEPIPGSPSNFNQKRDLWLGLQAASAGSLALPRLPLFSQWPLLVPVREC
jgi:hypothetical protein